MKWEYAGHYAWFHVTQKHGLEWEDEGVWLIRIGDKSYRLVEGVNWLGRNGWELVGLHQINRFYGGEFLHYQTLEYFYIFKRPLPSDTEEYEPHPWDESSE